MVDQALGFILPSSERVTKLPGLCLEGASGP